MGLPQLGTREHWHVGVDHNVAELAGEDEEVARELAGGIYY